GGRMMIPALFTAALWGQASLTTNWVNGLQMAVVLHGATGMAVSDGSPAEPGETLILQGAGFSGDAQFVLPGAGGGIFLEIAVSGGEGNVSPAAVVPVDAPFDAVQLAAADVQ